MNEQRQHKAIEDQIDRDIQFDCGTAVGMLALRLFAGLALFWTHAPNTRRFLVEAQQRTLVPV